MSRRHTTSNPTAASPGAIVEWRRRRLLAAGFTPGVAADFARNDGIDLHAALDLIDRGCPPALAARIIAPLHAPPGRSRA